MSFPVKIIRATPATRESLAQLIAAYQAADPALAVTPTSGNFVSTEEKYAELNIAASTAGVSTAVAAANTAIQARIAAFTAAVTPGPLGDGIEGVALETMLTTDLAAAIPSLAPGAVAVEGSIEIGLAEFFALYLALLELNRARLILVPCLAANHL